MTTTARDGFRRARRPAEKQSRRNDILRATARLVACSDLHELSLNGIAREAGLSKPNLYRYFASREDILLRLFLDDLADLAGAFVDELGRLVPPAGSAAVGTILANIYAARPRLCRFLGILPDVLEQNVPTAILTEAKRAVLRDAETATRALHRVLPDVSFEKCGWLNNTVAMLAAGLWPAANPAAGTVAILKQAEFASLRVDFAQNLKQAVDMLVSGLRATSGMDALRKA